MAFEVKRVQLVVKISGREMDARDECSWAEIELTAAGYEVFNPFNLCAHIAPFQKAMGEKDYWRACVRICEDNIFTNRVQVLALLTGYKDSYGAQCEINTGLYARVALVDKNGIVANGKKAHETDYVKIAAILAGW